MKKKPDDPPIYQKKLDAHDDEGLEEARRDATEATEKALMDWADSDPDEDLAMAIEILLPALRDPSQALKDDSPVAPLSVDDCRSLAHMILALVQYAAAMQVAMKMPDGTPAELRYRAAIDSIQEAAKSVANCSLPLYHKAKEIALAKGVSPDQIPGEPDPMSAEASGAVEAIAKTLSEARGEGLRMMLVELFSTYVHPSRCRGIALRKDAAAGAEFSAAVEQGHARSVVDEAGFDPENLPRSVMERVVQNLSPETRAEVMRAVADSVEYERKQANEQKKKEVLN